jgi:excisionase family DNA binding protein
MTENKQPMTATEVATVLGLPRRTIQRQAKAGDLPTIGKLPGSRGAYLFDRDAILERAA